MCIVTHMNAKLFVNNHESTTLKFLFSISGFLDKRIVHIAFSNFHQILLKMFYWATRILLLLYACMKEVVYVLAANCHSLMRYWMYFWVHNHKFTHIQERLQHLVTKSQIPNKICGISLTQL